MLRLASCTLTAIAHSSKKISNQCIFTNNGSGGVLLGHSFHTSSAVLGRRNGSKALEFPTRSPSKKQLRKKNKLIESLKLKRDPAKEKLKLENIKRQIQSPDFQKNMKELGDR